MQLPLYIVVVWRHQHCDHVSPLSLALIVLLLGFSPLKICSELKWTFFFFLFISWWVYKTYNSAYIFKKILFPTGSIICHSSSLPFFFTVSEYYCWCCTAIYDHEGVNQERVSGVVLLHCYSCPQHVLLYLMLLWGMSWHAHIFNWTICADAVWPITVGRLGQKCKTQFFVPVQPWLYAEVKRGIASLVYGIEQLPYKY